MAFFKILIRRTKHEYGNRENMYRESPYLERFIMKRTHRVKRFH